MDNVRKIVIQIVVVVIAVLVGGIIGGAIICFLWPFSLPAVFPGLVASGVLASKITFWQAFCISALSTVLFKAATPIETKKD